MTLLSPLFFYAALGVAAATVALHFIVTRQPTSSPLPTVRFVPRGSVQVVTLARPRDLLLLLLRVLLILLIGLAFARPVLVPERRPVARIVVADVSSAVAEIAEVRDSVRALLGPGDALVVFDRSARVIRRDASDTAIPLARSNHEGRLSAALAAALRTAPELRAEADSIEIAVVSPLRAEEVDAATEEIRALWPGRIRLVPVAARAESAMPAPGLQVRADSDDDGVALATRLAGLLRGEANVRIVRGESTPEDEAWAAAGPRTLVRWPAVGAPPGWRERVTADTVGAVTAGDAVLVYPFERRWELEPEAVVAQGTGRAMASSEDVVSPGAPGAGASLEGTVPPASGDAPITRIAARWVDGEPAAIERLHGEGCVRDVVIPVPGRGDVAFRPAFGQLVRALAAPCRVVAGGEELGEDALLSLAGSGPLAARESIPQPEEVTAPIVPWLLALALALALAELWARRRSTKPRPEAADWPGGGTGGAVGSEAEAPGLAASAAGGREPS